MKMKEYVGLDNMSEGKSKKLRKLAVKIMKFARRNGIDRVDFDYISKDCGIGDTTYDYMNVRVLDTKRNHLFDIALWR